ncbi:MAG TPA: hypothetical protein VG738_11815 [Chitinophagaceae bacterium]|nr:hypothetical protein [Chitinophagaceae bacterium]
MQKQWLFVVIALLLTGCKRAAVDKALVYATLNNIIQTDSFFARTICSKFRTPDIPDSIIKEYLDGNNEFVKEQLKDARESFLDTGRIYFYWKRKHALEKAYIDTNCVGINEVILTYPVFSSDHNTVVVGLDEDDSGFMAVYRFVDARWVMLKKYYSWVY